MTWPALGWAPAPGSSSQALITPFGCALRGTAAPAVPLRLLLRADVFDARLDRFFAMSSLPFLNRRDTIARRPRRRSGTTDRRVQRPRRRSMDSGRSSPSRGASPSSPTVTREGRSVDMESGLRELTALSQLAASGGGLATHWLAAFQAWDDWVCNNVDEARVCGRAHVSYTVGKSPSRRQPVAAILAALS